MKCCVNAPAPKPHKVGGGEVITWAVSCVARCALSTFIERRASPPLSVTAAKEK